MPKATDFKPRAIPLRELGEVRRSVEGFYALKSSAVGDRQIEKS